MKDWGVRCTNLVELGSLAIQVLHNLDNKRKVRSMESLTRDVVMSTPQIDYMAYPSFPNARISLSTLSLHLH